MNDKEWDLCRNPWRYLSLGRHKNIGARGSINPGERCIKYFISLRTITISASVIYKAETLGKVQGIVYVKSRRGGILNIKVVYIYQKVFTLARFVLRPRRAVCTRTTSLLVFRCVLHLAVSVRSFQITWIASPRCLKSFPVWSIRMFGHRYSSVAGRSRLFTVWIYIIWKMFVSK